MEVTVDNFSEALQRVKTSLEEKSACFCAFDLEFTGLSIQGGGSDTDLDSIQDRYARARETAQNFLPLQFGLSIFHLRDGAYEAETFTFHLFPKPCKAARYDRRFTCQASSVAFLMQHGFSFDKCFGKGIRSVPLSKASAAFPKRDGTPQQRRVQITNDRDKKFASEVQTSLQAVLAGSQASVKLETPNGYFRLVVHQLVDSMEAEHGGLYLKVDKDDSGNLIVTKVSKEEKEMHKLQELQAKDQEAEEAVGFSRVVEALGRSGLPIIGHNMLLDITYTMEHFVAPLPPTWQAFKASAGSFFTGGIWDTKYLSGLNSSLFTAGTGLAQAYHSLCAGTQGQPPPEFESYARMERASAGDHEEELLQPLRVAHASGFSRYGAVGQGTAHHHEAGFDAFMTGTVFSRLLWLAQALQMPSAAAATTAASQIQGPSPVFSIKPLLQYANRVFLFRTDMPYAAVIGADPVVERPHVIYVTGFRPGVVKNQDIWNACSAVQLGRIRVSWIDATSCFLVLLDGESQGGAVDEQDAWRRVQLALLHGLEMPVRACTYSAWQKGHTGVEAASSGKQKPMRAREEEIEEERPSKRKRSEDIADAKVPSIAAPEHNGSLQEHNGATASASTQKAPNASIPTPVSRASRAVSVPSSCAIM